MQGNLLPFTFYLLPFTFGRTLGSLASYKQARGQTNSSNTSSFLFTCETEMVLCGQVYCSNCILKSVLVKNRIHTSIRNKKDSKSSGKTYLSQAGVDRGAQQLCHIFTKGRPCSSTQCITTTITTALAHTQINNAPHSPVQAVDLAQKEKVISQADLPSNTAVFSVMMSPRQVKA